MELSYHHLLKVFLFTLISSIFTISASTIKPETKTVCKSEGCLLAAKILENSMDTKVNPCDDFYQYACGNWPKNYGNKIDPSISMNSFDSRTIQLEEEITEFLKQNNSQSEPESVHKARQLYSMCLNRESYTGVEQLRDILSNIGLPVVPISTNENPHFDYASALAKTTKLTGIEMFFRVAIFIDPGDSSFVAIHLTKPPSENRLSPTPAAGNQEKIQKQSINETNLMESIVEKMCAISSSSSCTTNDSNLKAAVLKQNKERKMLINKARNASLSMLNTLETLQRVSNNIADTANPSIPKLNWTRYIEEILKGTENEGLNLRSPSNVPVVISEASYIKDVIKFIHERNIKEIEFGLWWNVVSTLLPYTDFDTYQTINNINSLTQREKKCKELVKTWFKVAIGYMYLENEKYQTAKIEVETLLKYIQDSYKKIFQNATWMDEKLVDIVLTKLTSLKSLIAYPNPEELTLILNDIYRYKKPARSFLDIMISIIQNEIENSLNNSRWVNKYDFKTQSWLNTLTDVSLSYISSENTIIIPAGLLGPPLYTDTPSLKALIYGSIGYIIGHELTLGSNSNGMTSIHKGFLAAWSNNGYSVKFGEKSKCFLKAYDTYNSTFEGVYQKVNSTLTLHGDISDNVGFKAALLAYKNYVSEKGQEPSLQKFENFTSEQLFSLRFANFWCESPTNASFSTSIVEHSPKAVRINGVFKNSHELSSIWNCPKGTNMNPSDEKCSLW